MHTLILCNGLPPNKTLVEEKFAHTDLFITADGGGNVACRMQLYPDVVIGDLDSFIPHSDDNFEVIRKPSPYSNDLEKALQLANERGAATVEILGATGHRLDHTLKNLSVLKQFADRFKKLQFEDDFGITRLLPAEFSSTFAVGTALSLFPLSGRVDGIITEGLKFNLHDESIENGVRDGSSNTVESSPIFISHRQGDLILFIAK